MTIERYEGFDQDDKGISRGQGRRASPGSGDPAGNILSVAEGGLSRLRGPGHEGRGGGAGAAVRTCAATCGRRRATASAVRSNGSAIASSVVAGDGGDDLPVALGEDDRPAGTSAAVERGEAVEPRGVAGV